MAELTLEKMVEELKNNLGKNLFSIILFGSAAAGDHLGKKSDYNLLVLTELLGISDLQKICKVSNQWIKQGNPPPLLFTLKRFKNSADVFPIEFMDIRDNHKILYGENPLLDLSIVEENLRLELEHELKGKLIQISERFLMTESNPKLVTNLMVQTLSTFLILFKNALRLFDQKPPLRKMEALEELHKHIPCDVEVFRMVERLKTGEKIKDLDMIKLFERYLKAIENIVDAIDGHIHSTKAI